MSNVYQNTKKMLSDAKFYESYARYSEENNRYETWNEAVDRVIDMHKEFYNKKLNPNLNDVIDSITVSYKNKLILGAQRALQFGGKQMLKNHLKMYNCLGSYADRPEFFGEYFFGLLSGCGAGFSVQKHHVDKLPSIISRHKMPKIFTPEDSIKGWADCLDVLMSSFFEDGGKYPEYKGHRVYFDLSKIRVKGSMISGGFKAPGPEPLRQALDKIEYILQGLTIKNKTSRLKPIQVYDICMHTADAVLSGGIRRAATICLFSPDDEEMATAKTGNWYIDNPQRGRSNNSALIVRNEITREQFANLMKSVKEFGEPGFYFADSKEHVTNPCVSGDTPILTKNGYFPIIDLIGQEVEIWNGETWEKVIPKKTGHSTIVRVTLSDGTNLDCTPYHRWCIDKKGFVETKDLIEGDKLEKFIMPIIKEGEEYSIDAYSQGFYSGDGTKNLNWSSIYLPKYSVIPRLIGDVREQEDNCGGRKKWTHGPMFEKTFVPVNGSLDYKINWLAGLLDSDGTKVFSDLSKTSYSLQISSIDEKFLQDVRLMLTTMGVQAKIGVMYEEKGPCQDINSKFYGYNSQKCYRLCISTGDVKTIIDLGLKTNRIDLTEFTIQRDARRFVTVVSIDILSEEIVPVYCFNEPKTFRGTFNGIVTGQCVELGFYSYDEEGNSGWQGCNLVEINGGMCDNEETFYKACEDAAAIATLQAGYTNFDFFSETSKKIFEREALIGVSITGWMNNPKILFNEKILKEGVRIIKETNKKVAKLIDINPSARCTVVKPSGSASVLLMTASGIHGEPAPMYIRHVQMNMETEVAQLIKKTNPHMVEKSVWSTNGTDYVIAFPIISAKNSIYKNDLLGVKLLEYVKKAQEFWVIEGTNVDLCVDKTVRNNVSNTINVDDWDEVEEYIFNNKEYFSGISLLAAAGDKDYNQAPWTEVISAEDIVEKYSTGAIFASGLIVDALAAFNQNLWIACQTANGIGEDLSIDNAQNNLKKDWIRRFEKFASSYFNSKKEAEYCLKDVYNLHKWEKINQNFTSIDWVNELKEKKYIDADTLASEACSGGNCEIV